MAKIEQCMTNNGQPLFVNHYLESSISNFKLNMCEKIEQCVKNNGQPIVAIVAQNGHTLAKFVQTLSPA